MITYTACSFRWSKPACHRSLGGRSRSISVNIMIQYTHWEILCRIGGGRTGVALSPWTPLCWGRRVQV